MNANIRTNPDITWDVSVTGGDPKVGSMAGDLTSDWMFSEEQTSAHNLYWPATGSPIGVFSIEMSMDGVTVDHTYAASDFFPALTAPAGTAGRFAFEIVSLLPYRRIKYTRTSGTGSLSGKSRTKRA